MEAPDVQNDAVSRGEEPKTATRIPIPVKARESEPEIHPAQGIREDSMLP